ncbi:MAG: DUF2791 family P-loop domain-containing protein [Chloroflexi bacterium]|nr:DUF2791 family P-loop domain-containing protein [Chloroflexota bacterium]
MPAYLKPQEWLTVVRTEYLETFIRGGGAAVKFVIPADEIEAVEVKNGLRKLAEEGGFHFAPVDASTTKVHLIDQVFYEVARNVDWRGLAYSFLRRSLQGHYKLPETREEFNLKNLAVLNEYEEPDMRLAVNQRFKKSLYLDYAMTQEFRIAMTRLCVGLLDPAEVSPELCSAVIDWLRGELHKVSVLKSALIFQKIGRHNARHMLFSLSHWLKLSGSEGLVLLLDISRYLQERPKGPVENLYYSKPAMVLDCYEVLRQFIDGTDESESLLVVVVAPTGFLTDEKRGVVKIYDALKLRIWDEVSDPTRANPLSSLVRISTCSRTATDRGQA